MVASWPLGRLQIAATVASQHNGFKRHLDRTTASIHLELLIGPQDRRILLNTECQQPALMCNLQTIDPSLLVRSIQEPERMRKFWMKMRLVTFPALSLGALSVPACATTGVVVLQCDIQTGVHETIRVDFDHNVVYDSLQPAAMPAQITDDTVSWNYGYDSTRYNARDQTTEPIHMTDSGVLDRHSGFLNGSVMCKPSQSSF